MTTSGTPSEASPDAIVRRRSCKRNSGTAWPAISIIKSSSFCFAVEKLLTGFLPSTADEVKASDIRDVVAQAGQVSPGRGRTRGVYLSALFGWLMRDGLITANPIRFKPTAIWSCDLDGNPRAHAPDPHAPRPKGIPKGTLMSGSDH